MAKTPTGKTPTGGASGGKTPTGKNTSGRGQRDLKVKVKSARGRKLSSTRWLQRQLNDPYVKRANAEGYRGRAAYKIMELDDKYRFLVPGARVVDLGAAPVAGVRSRSSAVTFWARKRARTSGPFWGSTCKRWSRLQAANCTSLISWKTTRTRSSKAGWGARPMS